MYETRTMKLVEIILRGRAGKMRENDGGVNLIKIYCKNIYKCHNVSPPYNCYRLIKNFLDDTFIYLFILLSAAFTNVFIIYYT
jgi:hypothetical protein